MRNLESMPKIQYEFRATITLLSSVGDSSEIYGQSPFVRKLLEQPLKSCAVAVVFDPYEHITEH